MHYMEEARERYKKEQEQKKNKEAFGKTNYLLDMIGWNDMKPPTVTDRTGNLKEQYQIGTPTPLNMTSIMPEYTDRVDNALNSQTGLWNRANQGLDTLNTRANATGPSTSANYLLEANQNSLNKNIGNIRGQSNAALEDTMSKMAASGGFGSGSRERMSNMWNRNAMSTEQGLRSSADQSRLGILSDDENTKLNLQTQLPSMFSNLANTQTQNQLQGTSLLGNLASTEQGRDLDAQKWNREADLKTQEWNKGTAMDSLFKSYGLDNDKMNNLLSYLGAERQAIAQENSGKK